MTPDEIRHLAALARLPLRDDELQRTAVDLRAILASVASLPPLDEVDGPTGAEPGLAALPLRADEVRSDALHAPPAEFAPAWADGFFVVPRLAALDPDLGAEELT